MSCYNALHLSTVPSFTNLTKLTRRSIGATRWENFDLCKLPQSLTNINLNYALNTSIPPNFAAWFPNLKILDLWSNYIQEFPSEIIQNLNLTKVNLRKNLLVTIPGPMAFPFIDILDLKRNKFTSLPDFSNTSLKYLTLSRNPLICSQALCWLRMRPWVSDTTILADTPTCASPESLRGTPLMEADPVTVGLHLESEALIQYKDVVLPI